MAAAKPVLATEVVNIPELGGDVTVRQLMLDELIVLRDIGETAYQMLPAETLARATDVRDESGSAWTVEDWRIFGGKYPGIVNRLMETVDRLKFSEEKKDDAPS